MSNEPFKPERQYPALIDLVQNEQVTLALIMQHLTNWLFSGADAPGITRSEFARELSSAAQGNLQWFTKRSQARDFQARSSFEWREEAWYGGKQLNGWLLIRWCGEPMNRWYLTPTNTIHLALNCTQLIRMVRISSTLNWYLPAGFLDREYAVENLSRREREVLNHMIKGLNNAEIVEQMSITLRSVHTHQQHIYQKLGVHSQIEAIIVYVLATAGQFDSD